MKVILYVLAEDPFKDWCAFYLQTVLELGDVFVLGDEGEELPLHGERQRYDERDKHQHLKHEKGENLLLQLLA